MSVPNMQSKAPQRFPRKENINAAGYAVIGAAYTKTKVLIGPIKNTGNNGKECSVCVSRTRENVSNRWVIDEKSITSMSNR